MATGDRRQLELYFSRQCGSCARIGGQPPVCRLFWLRLIRDTMCESWASGQFSLQTGDWTTDATNGQMFSGASQCQVAPRERKRASSGQMSAARHASLLLGRLTCTSRLGTRPLSLKSGWWRKKIKRRSSGSPCAETHYEEGAAPLLVIQDE